jgi:hypothetical protein
MGIYTAVFVNVDLKSDMPDHMLDVLRCMCGNEFQSMCGNGMTEGKDVKKVMKGLPPGWSGLFLCGSYEYRRNTHFAILLRDAWSGYYSLIGRGETENYTGEIEKFFEWLIPWVHAEKGAVIGYTLHEEATSPVLVCMPPKDINKIDKHMYIEKWYPQ